MDAAAYLIRDDATHPSDSYVPSDPFAPLQPDRPPHPAPDGGTASAVPGRRHCHCHTTVTRAVAHWRAAEITPAISFAEDAARQHRCDGHPRPSQPAGVVLTLLWALLRDPGRATTALNRHVHRSDDDPVVLILRSAIAVSSSRYDEAADLAERGLAQAGAATAADQTARFLAPVGHLVGATVGLRLSDVRSAVRYARKLTEDSMFGRLGFLAADAAWITAQIYGTERGPEAAAVLLREFTWQPGRVRELLVNQPAAAPSLVRCALDAGDRETADRVVLAARLVASKNGDRATYAASARHAAGIRAQDPDLLLRAAADHVDPWAAALAAEQAGALAAVEDSRRSDGIRLLERSLDDYSSLGSLHDVARVRSRLRDLGSTRRVPAARSSPPRSRTHTELTTTENRVADLVSQGLTNVQVANQLFLSQHTIAYHLKSIFTKLGVSSRGELTSHWVHQTVARSA